MKNLGYILAVLATAGLAGCQSASDHPASSPAASLPAAAASPGLAAPPAAQPANAAGPFAGYRRYRGTVGGQPVTVELTIKPKDDAASPLGCEGTYRYDRHPGGQLLLSAPLPYQPGQPLTLAEADSEHPRQSTGRWQATQAAGPVLAGTWTSPSGKQLPFSLREDYTDGQGHLMAMRYEILTEEVKGRACKPEPYSDETKTEYRQRLKGLLPASLTRQYLHLLGSEATRPALRHLQCPPPHERHAAMQATLVEAGDCETLTDDVSVTYNDFGLLATGEYHEEYYQGAAHPNHSIEATIYDLRTGQALALGDLLKPGTDHALRQLITPKLRTEMELDATEVLHPAEGDTTTTELPRTGVGLAADGLVFQYSDYELGAYAYGMPAVTIPWAELLPLLRPTSPVARMLRERGLWRDN